MNTETLMKHLQKFYISATTQYEVFKELISKSKKYIVNIENLHEQYMSCLRLDWSSSPLGKFQGLQDNLQYKLLIELEKNMKELVDFMSSINSCCGKVKSCYLLAWNYYEENSKDIDFNQLVETEATRPTVAEMLENSETLFRCFHTESCRRKYLLSHLDYADEKCISQLVSQWMNIQDFKECANDILPRMVYFVDEKIP